MSPGGDDRPPFRLEDGGGLDRGVVCLFSLTGGGETVLPLEPLAVIGDGSPLFFTSCAVDGTSVVVSSPAFDRRAERRGFLVSASSTVEPYEHENQHQYERYRQASIACCCLTRPRFNVLLSSSLLAIMVSFPEFRSMYQLKAEDAPDVQCWEE